MKDIKSQHGGTLNQNPDGALQIMVRCIQSDTICSIGVHSIGDGRIDLMEKLPEWIEGERWLEEMKNIRSIRLDDHFSWSTRLDIAMPQPQYNLVQLNALRGNSKEMLSCDVNRDEFLAAIEKIMNVTITKNEDYV